MAQNRNPSRDGAKHPDGAMVSTPSGSPEHKQPGRLAHLSGPSHHFSLSALFPVFNGYDKAWLVGDIIAGVTLAAVAIPECMGYTKIAGTPIITGLYTILLPIAIFALLGSSRHLVVGADSATAAILYAGLLTMAKPYSAHWLTLASASAILTSGFLFLSAVFRLGFLADFLSRTVLVGFLSGVGVSLLFGQLPDMCGITVHGKGFFHYLEALGRALPHTRLPTLLVAVGVLAVIIILEKITPRIPGALLAVALAIAITWAFHLERFGIDIVGKVKPGFPHFGVPRVTVTEGLRILPLCGSMFLVIMAQSAATSRSFAQKYNEHFNENRDLLGLGAANMIAGLSSTFVVNGSPTKTAVVDSAGGRSQVSQLTTAGVVIVVLLFATSLIEKLPVAALAALVFLIGVHLINLKALSEIYRFRKRTFMVAISTLVAVVILGVEKGIFVAVGLSILDHMEQEYHPRDVVLQCQQNHWDAVDASPGRVTTPGLLIYRFQAPLFFANVDFFTSQVHQLVSSAPEPVKWLALDLVSMNDIDYTAGLDLATLVKQIEAKGVSIALVHYEGVQRQLESFGILKHVPPERRFRNSEVTLEAFHKQQDSNIPTAETPEEARITPPATPTQLRT